MNLLEVKQLSKTYGSEETAVQALKDVNFAVPQGEFVAIVGESGGGKSTLLNMVGALDTPTSGYLLTARTRFQTFHNKLMNAGMRQSMTRVGRCIDSGSMEGYWDILKSEMYYLKKFTSQEELTKAIESYIHFYNTKRYQLKLKCMTPLRRCEKFHSAAQQSGILSNKFSFVILSVYLTGGGSPLQSFPFYGITAMLLWLFLSLHSSQR